ncbi:hypothetical protein [Actinoplanes sp. NPDC049802]|uniref:hypothetical protein n=1 Tax=Actinoplanes sp. NPDC049802 TaxID=3154742 RepID=UPI0033C842B1
MDRTAAVGSSPDSAGAGEGEERTASGLPLRRPKKPALEPEGQPVSWFGGSPSGPSSSDLPLSGPSSSDLPLSDLSPPVLSSGPSPSDPSSGPSRSVSSPPAFGPASPAGPGRTSFGFSDGPIGRSRTGRAPGEDGTANQPVVPPAGGVMGTLAAAAGALPIPDRPPLRRRGRSRPAEDSGEPPIEWTADPAPSGMDGLSSTGAPLFPAAPVETPPSAAVSPSSPGAAPGPSPEPVWGPIGSPAGESFWSGARDQRAPGADQPVVWGDAPAAPAAATRPRQSRLVTAGMTFLGVVALAVVALTGVVYYTGENNQISDMLQLGGDDQRVVTGPLEARTLATFEMLAATDRVRLSIADLGSDMYRISAPEGAGIRPSAEFRDDRLRVDVARDTAGTGGEVEVVLSAKVRWTIRFSGYSAERIVNLSEGRIRGIELVGGTRRAEMTLADASGTVPMKITGGIEELILRAPSGSPVRIKVGGGAGTVTAGSRTLKDVAPGSTLTPKGWASGDRYDVDAVAPVTLLTVETA